MITPVVASTSTQEYGVLDQYRVAGWELVTVLPGDAGALTYYLNRLLIDAG